MTTSDLPVIPLIRLCMAAAAIAIIVVLWRTESKGITACIRFLQRSWRYFRPPFAPCMFCGKPTRERNAFDHSIVRHQKCRDEAEERNKIRMARREKIDLIKQAVREVQATSQDATLLMDFVRAARKQERVLHSNLAVWGHSVFCNYQTDDGNGEGHCNCGVSDMLTALRKYDRWKNQPPTK